MTRPLCSALIIVLRALHANAAVDDSSFLQGKLTNLPMVDKCVDFDSPADVCGCKNGDFTDTATKRKDNRCCLLATFNDLLPTGQLKFGNTVLKSMKVTFRVVSRDATDLWWVLAKGNAQGNMWQFNSFNLAKCRMFSAASGAAGTRQYVQYFPQLWSGNMLPTFAGFFKKYNTRQPGDQQTIGMEITLEKDMTFSFDLTAIPGGSPGVCLQSSYVNSGYLDVKFESEVLDKSCESRGDPSNPLNWKAINGNPTGTCYEKDAVPPPYRKNWYGTEACYSYEDCKAKAGGWCSYMGSRGMKVTSTSNCTQNDVCSWSSGGRTVYSCSWGATDDALGSRAPLPHGQDCFTAPHDDWKLVSCPQADLAVNVCNWGDEDCEGFHGPDRSDTVACEGGRPWKQCSQGDKCDLDGSCCPSSGVCLPVPGPNAMADPEDCAVSIAQMSGTSNIFRANNTCQGFALARESDGKMFGCFVLDNSNLPCGTVEKPNSDVARCALWNVIQDDPTLYWTRRTCDNSVGKRWCEVKARGERRKCKNVCELNPPTSTTPPPYSVSACQTQCQAMASESTGFACYDYGSNICAGITDAKECERAGFEWCVGED
eukprot:TRINITY_DN20584_c0_g2_i1.p1 TRINITY_DN20584_c0_g2~~TRINITY_DN20584_c0_g2_i1.p1  ORF type:complete len:598 (+),score=65.87 TRINITY_DN20584_c0_g2_i1:32-1825(+)